MDNSICAVIVTYNCNDTFLQTINAVLPQVDEAIIVDNGSTSKSLDILHILQNNKNIHIIFLDDNYGIAKALNEGVKYGLSQNYEWIMTLDQDSILSENMVKIMLNTYNSFDDNEKKITLSLAPEFIDVNLEADQKNRKEEHGIAYQTTVICSGNIVNRKIFDSVGFFDEKLFIDRVDDDFCFRVNLGKFKIIKIMDAHLYHHLGNPVKRRFLFITGIPSNHNPTRRYYITRNRLYCWKKYKKYFPEYIAFDKKCFINEMGKIFLFEKDKFLKFKMICKGIHDYRHNHYGKITKDPVTKFV